MSMKKFGAAIFIFVGILLLGGGIYSKLEGWSIVDSIYFSAVTITTLGYGDFVPQTDAGKLFTILFSVSGIAIALYILTMLGKSFFTIDLHRGVHITNLKKDKKFNVEKMAIGALISYHTSRKDYIQGVISEIGLDYIKMRVEKRDDQLVPKKDQKIVVITSKGKMKRL
jgi:voltage-gated potassium channel